MAPTCPNESCEACSKYLIRICGMTMVENVLLKQIIFYVGPCGIYEVVVIFTAIFMLYYIFAKCIIFVALLLYLTLILVRTLNFVLIVGWLQVMHSLLIVWLHH